MYIGRLAPSPTGLLHLGHATTFRVAQERARNAEGSLLLRIEDLDRSRCKPEFEDSLVDDLKWAGLRWDGDPVRQTERMPIYLAAWRRLAAFGRIYPCGCSRKDVELALSAPHSDDDGEPIYPGTCRPTGFLPRSEPEPGGINWRFAVNDGEVVEFLDGRAGTQRFVSGRDFGDFLIWRKDGYPAYQLAVVVDDAEMGISEVIRGEDLLASTAQQLLIYRALGLPAPAEADRMQAGERMRSMAKKMLLEALSNKRPRAAWV